MANRYKEASHALHRHQRFPQGRRDRARVTAILVRDQRRVLSEISLVSKVEDGVDRCLIDRRVALAGRALELADLDFSTAGELYSVYAAACW